MVEQGIEDIGRVRNAVSQVGALSCAESSDQRLD